jgi:hypothetical protein
MTVISPKLINIGLLKVLVPYFLAYSINGKRLPRQD